MTYTPKPTELHLRPEIATAIEQERAEIDRQIAELQRRKTRLRGVRARIQTIGRRAYLSMKPGKDREKRYTQAQGDGHRLEQELGGYVKYSGPLCSELRRYHVDLWVTLGSTEP